MKEIEIPRRPDLPEFSEEITIGDDLCDANGLVIERNLIDVNNHVNNAKYLTIYEYQRARCMEKMWKMSKKMIEENFGLRPFVTEGYVRFRQQLVRNDHVTIYTSAEVLGSRKIGYYQRIVKEGVEVGEFHCIEVMVNAKDKACTIPIEIRKKINQINSGKPLQ